MGAWASEAGRRGAPGCASWAQQVQSPPGPGRHLTAGTRWSRWGWRARAWVGVSLQAGPCRPSPAGETSRFLRPGRGPWSRRTSVPPPGSGPPRLSGPRLNGRCPHPHPPERPPAADASGLPSAPRPRRASSRAGRSAPRPGSRSDSHGATRGPALPRRPRSRGGPSRRPPPSPASWPSPISGAGAAARAALPGREAILGRAAEQLRPQRFPAGCAAAGGQAGAGLPPSPAPHLPLRPRPAPSPSLARPGSFPLLSSVQSLWPRCPLLPGCHAGASRPSAPILVWDGLPAPCACLGTATALPDRRPSPRYAYGSRLNPQCPAQEGCPPQGHKWKLPDYCVEDTKFQSLGPPTLFFLSPAWHAKVPWTGIGPLATAAT